MIHILTVHWESDRWVNIQLEYFNKNIKASYKVYAFLNSLPRDHRKKYFYSSTENIKSHAIKLNLLADMAILHSRNDDDWLMFIDGDAFPIGDIVSFGRSKLREHPLLAIQRIENFGDIQPHPAFCLTTVKFWKEINGDWKKGYEWKDNDGKKVTDIGGNLLEILNRNRIRWLPLLRSNKKELHKLWFGIYEDLIYHHGAGFRSPYSRIDKQDHLSDFSSHQKNRLLKRIYQIVKLKSKKKENMGRVIIEKNTPLAEKVFQTILDDPDFYKYFQESDISI